MPLGPPVRQVWMEKFGRQCRQWRLVVIGLFATLWLCIKAEAVPPPAGVAPVLAPAGGFGINGYVLANTPVSGVGNWSPRAGGSGAAVLDTNGVPLNPATTFHFRDAYNSTSDNTFIGGLKWTDNPNTWGWTTGKASSKTDINNVLLHIAFDTNGHTWVIVAADRLSTSGDSYIDFEFLQNSLVVNSNGTFTSSGPNGGRTTNDLLLSLAFTSGGSVADFLAYTWTSTSPGSFAYVDSTAALPAGRVFVAANTNIVTVPFGAFGSTNYSAMSFADAAVDLTALLGNIDQCLSVGFKTIMVKTKTSASSTATISDFINPIQYTFKLGPSASAGPDQTQCSQGDSTSFALQGYATPGLYPIASTTWSVVAGTASLDATNSLNTTAHVSSSTATLRLTVLQANGCTEASDVVLTAAPVPVASIAGPAIVCPTSSSQFLAPANMSSYSWTVSGEGTIFGPTNQQAVLVVAGATCGTNFTLSLTVANNGCPNTCATNVLVNNTLAPSITAPPDLVLSCPADTSTNNTGVAAVTDVCGAVTVSFSDSVTNGCGGTKTISRTWTASDLCGNTSSAVQTISVQDNTPPTITAPPNLVLECPANTSTNVTGVATAHDGCSAVTITFSDSVSNACSGATKTISRTWIATDGCGNSASALQTITVRDTTPPTITAPPNLVLECPANTSTNFTGVATAHDGCSAVTITYSDVVSNACSGATKTISRTWTATDACGNSASTVQTITVRDTTPPTVTAPPNLVLQCPAITATNATGVATAHDGCSAVTLAYSDSVSNSCGGTKIISRTWTATDACGNSASAIQTITVQDITPPTLTVPPNLVLQCPANTSTNATGTATATDTCSAAIISYSDVVSNTCSGATKTIFRTWTAADSCGNSTNAIQTITVQDTTPPTLSVPANVVLECPNTDTSTNYTGVATAHDGCSAVTITFSDSVSNTCSGATRTISRTWTAADACGNTASAVQIITVRDTTPPSFLTVPADLVLQCPANTTTNATGVATAQDTCSAVTVSYSDSVSNICGAAKVISRKWIATDACGNSTNRVQTITVQDLQRPTIVVPMNVTLECGSSTDPAATGTATATDICSAVTVTYSDSVSNICGGSKVITRTWTAADGCGNSVSGPQVITVLDRIPPNMALTFPWPCSSSQGGWGGGGGVAQIFASNYLTVFTNGLTLGIYDPASSNAAPNGLYWQPNSAGLAALQAAVSQGGGSGAPITQDAVNPTGTFSAGGLGRQTLALTLNVGFNAAGFLGASNVFGNLVYTNSGDSLNGLNVNQILNVANQALAGLPLPAGYNFSSLSSIINNLNVAFENCSMSSWAAAHLVAPTILTVQCPNQIPAPDPTTILASDTCSGHVTVTNLPDVMSSYFCPTHYIIQRTWVAQDPCGNTNSLSVYFEVLSTNVPALTCPPSLTLNCPADTSTNNTGSATAQGLCGPLSVSYSDVVSNLCGGTKIIFRTWSADACTSTSAVQTITVQDITPPTVTAPPDLVLQCPANTATNATGVAIAQDGCSAVTLAYSDSVSNTCGGANVISRTWTATDACGNSASAIQTITVQDVTPPMLTVPPNLVLQCPANTTTNATGTATATDTCSAAIISYSDSVSNTCGGAHIVFRTWTAADGCGNTTNAVQTITVQDTTPPTITAPPNLVLECPANTSTNFTGAATAHDGCSAVTITYSDVVSNACSGATKTIARTWIATDGCGNSASTVQTITVRDTTPPTVTAPPNLVLQCPANTATNATGVATAQDGCSAVTLAYSDSVSNSCGGTKIISRTWTATDACGNSASAIQTITVQDTTPPTLTVPPNLVLQCPANTATNATGVATATDSCSAAIISYSDVVSNTCSGATKTIFRTWTAADSCGNSTNAIQTITVQDITPPTLTVGPNRIVAAGQPWSFDQPTAVDTCSAATVTVLSTVTNLRSATMSVTRTWVATDACGNSSSAAQTIIVKLAAPTILSPPQSQTVAIGSSTTLRVTAGGSDPFTYQWQFNGTNIAGATSNSLTLIGLQFTNAGSYTVVVANSVGIATSPAAVVNVNPMLTIQPGGSTTFKVGSPLPGGLVLTWAGSFVLQSAPNPRGPYTDLVGAVSPYSVDPTLAPRMYFRLRPARFSLAITSVQNHQAALAVAGSPGINFIIQASTDLKSWGDLATNSAPGTFIDTQAGQYPARYYRVMLVPTN